MLTTPDVFPLRFSITMWLPFIDADTFIPRLLKHLREPDHAAADPDSIAKRALPDSIHITEILPRVGEGGAFVKVSHNPERQQLPELEKSIKTYLKENPIKPWFNPFQRVRTHLVRGRPWLEDLHRLPDPRLKVEFVPTSPGQSAEELSQETLYSLFRRYGRLTDITSQPTDSKDLPKYAYINFRNVKHAIVAKNCMHGFILPAIEGGGNAGTMLKLGYGQRRKAHKIWEWLSNHPRIVIPFVLALAGTVTVAIFDP